MAGFKKRHWTKEEEQYLQENWLIDTYEQMCNTLNVSKPTVLKKSREMGLCKRMKTKPRLEYRDRRKTIGKKICMKCLQSNKAFYPNSSNKDGLNHYCIDCKKTFDILELIVIGEKLCIKCKNFLPRTCFDVRMCKGSLTMRGECKECVIKSSSEKYRNDPDKFKERALMAFKNMTPEQREAYNARTREYRKNNPSYKDYMRQYRERNADKISANHKVCARIHQERIVTNLEDTYIVARLAQCTGIKRDQLMKIDGIENAIETKRIQLRIKRLAKGNEL